jgi:hypothetical protein
VILPQRLLQVIVPAIVQSLPTNSPIVHCISWLQAIRTFLDLKCTSSAQRAHLRTVLLPNYQKFCVVRTSQCNATCLEGSLLAQKVTTSLGKTFDWPKQHDILHHAADSIEHMGSAIHQTTRVGEGMLQEVKQLYRRTNGRNVESQVCFVQLRARTYTNCGWHPDGKT